MASIITTSSSTKITATTPQATITPVSSPSCAKSTNSTATDPATSSSAYSAKAIAVGFFPGAIFGAVAALLVSLWARRRTNENKTQIQEPKTRSHTPPTSSEGPHELNAVPPEALHELNAVPLGDVPLMHCTSSRMRSLFSGYPRAGSRLDKDLTPVPMAAPLTSTIVRSDTTLTDLMHAGHSQDGRPHYTAHEDSRQNPFRDPDP